MPCPAFNSAGFEIKRSSEDTESGLQNAIETLRDCLTFAWTIARGRRVVLFHHWHLILARKPPA
jgi:hypothetical protein